MEFLKINRFAGIFAIACACLFPVSSEASFLFVSSSNQLIQKDGFNYLDPENNINPELNGIIRMGVIAGNNLFYVKNSDNFIYKKNLLDNSIGNKITNLTTNFIQIRGENVYYNANGIIRSFPTSQNTETDGIIRFDLTSYITGNIGFNLSLDGNWVIFKNYLGNGKIYRMSLTEELIQITSASGNIGLRNGNLVDEFGNLFYEADDGALYKIDNYISLETTNNGVLIAGTDVLFQMLNGYNYVDSNYVIGQSNSSGKLFKKDILDSNVPSILSERIVISYVLKNFEAPQPPPQEIAINGLNCKSVLIPNLENVIWYNNFMDNTGFLQNIDDDGWNRMFAWSGTIYDLPESQYVNRAALYYADQTAGGNFASGSLNYPGTARTTIRGGNKSPLLLSFSDSEIKPNVVQWHGVNSVALGYAGTVQIQNTQLQESNEAPISATGGVATAVASGNERINKVLLNYSSGFNGFRYGIAPVTTKTSCSYKYNLCEWSIEGNNTVCQSGNLVGGIPAGNCVITGSGSVYGSGACVPETNESGAIIPPVIVPGVTVYDSAGNPVGNIYENESPVPDFSCGFLDSDNGLDTIGKSFKCAVSYIQNTFNVGKQGIDTIQGTSQTLGQSVDINPTTSTGSATGTLSNPLLAQLQGVDEGASETKYLKMTFGFFVFFFTILIVAVLATVLKGGIKKYFNQ